MKWLIAFFAALILVSLLSNLLIKDTKRRNLIVSIFFTVALALFCGLKSTNVGVDTLGYQKIFEGFKTLSFAQVLSKNGDKGFFCLNWIFAKAGFSFRTFSIVYYAIVWSIIGFSIYRCSKDVWLSYFIFVCLSLQWSFSALRQIMAMALVALAIASYLRIKKPAIALICYFSFTLLGVSFHSTALICLPLPLIIFFLKKRPLSLVVCCALFFVYLAFCRTIWSTVLEASNSYYTPVANNRLPMGGLMFFGIFLIAFLLYFDTKPKLFINSFFLKNNFLEKRGAKSGNVVLSRVETSWLMCMVYVGSFAASTSLINTVLPRFSWFFFIPISIVVVETICAQKSTKLRIFGRLACVTFFIFYFFYTVKSSGYSTYTFGYTFFWE